MIMIVNTSNSTSAVGTARMTSSMVSAAPAPAALPQIPDPRLQVGTTGPVKAVYRYDAFRGAEFTRRAVPYVQGKRKRFIRDTTWSVRVPWHTQEFRVDLARDREGLEEQGSHEPPHRPLESAGGTSV
ncbi:hypothetical protein [Streptomyces sp. NPDC018045]|uniref:hypothetical protein n=1 Tax=Streptomyces sp. NPDC018045 TaxID=3365037 RepID=UPI0037B6E271